MPTLPVALVLSLIIIATPLVAQEGNAQPSNSETQTTVENPSPQESAAAQTAPRPPEAAVKALDPVRKLRLITETQTANHIAKFDGNGGYANSQIYDDGGDMTTVASRLRLGSLSYIYYPAVPGGGNDLSGLMGSTLTFSMGFNSEANYSGTQGALSGRQMYVYDRPSSTFRAVVDGQGTWWFGSSPTNYGLKILAPTGSAVGMTIDSSGKVGIGGPADAAYRLKVVGNAHFAGTVTGQNIQAHYQDIAEWVPSATDLVPGTVVVLNLERDNQVMASATAYDTTVAGVVSAQPGLSLGIESEGTEQIATTGRVKVRVDARSKPIRVGDLLVTSDAPGTAMRSEPMNVNGRPFHQPGTIIGKALQSLDGGVGEILVLLSMQ